MGILRDPDSGEVRRLVLDSTKYLSSLSRVAWEKQGDDEVALEKPLQLFFRRHRLDCEVLKYPSDTQTKFDLFQRLNRGGEYANPQEVRTCSMVLANPGGTKALREFAKRSDFREMFHVSERNEEEQKDLEYVVRLVCHTFEDFSKTKDVQDYLDSAIVKIISSMNIASVLEPIQWAVELLYDIFGADALMSPSNDGDTASGGRFSLRALEGIAVGLCRNYDKISRMDPEARSRFVRERVGRFWGEDKVAEMSAPGLRGTARIRKSVPFGAQWFDPDATI
jgi:hypothetical protein